MRRNLGRTRSRSLSHGFTLIELLIAFVLLTLVAVGLSAAVRAVGQAQERVEERLARADDQRVVVAFLERLLQRTVIRKRPAVQEQQSVYYFAGQPTSVMWMGVMPANYGAGGRALFRLEVEAKGGANEGALVLRWVPWSGELDFPVWSDTQSRVLVERVRAFALRYFDAEESSEWLTVWSVKGRLPERIELRLVTDTGPWPPMIAPLYRQGRDGSSADGFSFGGAP